MRRRDAEAQKAAERDLDNAAEAVSGGGGRLERDSGPRRAGGAGARGPPGRRRPEAPRRAAGAARGRAKKPTAAAAVAAGPGPVGRVRHEHALRRRARRAAARARDDDFLDRRPGESPSDAARRFVHDASTSPPRARPGQAASTAPDAPPRASGVDAEVDATPSYMQPTHRSGYRYKIDKTDGNWYRSDDPRMRPLDPRERVAVAAATATPRPVGRCVEIKQRHRADGNGGPRIGRARATTMIAWGAKFDVHLRAVRGAG